MLDNCESKVTDFMADYTAATDHIKLGAIFSDNDVIREGYFRVSDSFVHLTPMTRGCWESAWRLGDSLENISNTTTLSEEQALLNLINEYYRLVNNVSVFFADFFFEDWTSLGYYAGDTVNRLLVQQHT